MSVIESLTNQLAGLLVEGTVLLSIQASKVD